MESIKMQTKVEGQTIKVEHIIEGKKFVVTRHFVGDKDLQSLIMDLAVSRAKREMGL